MADMPRDDHHDAEQRLSPVGAARRDEMLDALLRQVPLAASRRRRRRAAASALVFVGGLGIVGYAWQASRWTRPAQPTVQLTSDVPDRILLPASEPARVEQVATDESVVARLAASTNGALIERVSDDELLRTLSAIGRPAGLMHDGDRVVLTADVTTRPKGPGASAI